MFKHKISNKYIIFELVLVTSYFSPRRFRKRDQQTDRHTPKTSTTNIYEQKYIFIYYILYTWSFLLA